MNRGKDMTQQKIESTQDMIKLISVLNHIVKVDYGSDRKAIDAIISTKNVAPSFSALYRARKGKTKSLYLISCYITDLLSAGTIPLVLPKYLNREHIQLILKSIIKNKSFISYLIENLTNFILKEKITMQSSENFQEQWNIDNISLYDIEIIKLHIHLNSDSELLLIMEIKKEDIYCDLNCMLVDGEIEETEIAINISSEVSIFIPIETNYDNPPLDEIMESLEITELNILMQ